MSSLPYHVIIASFIGDCKVIMHITGTEQKNETSNGETKPVTSKPRSIRMSIRVKLLLIFTLLFTIAFGLSYYWFYRFATELAMDNLRKDLIGTAQLAAARIDPQEHTEVLEDGEEDDTQYTHIAEQLRAVRDSNPKVKFIYTMVSSSDANTLLFVVSADEDPETRAGLRQEYDISEYPQMRQAFRGATADPEIVWDGDFNEWVFSGYAPIETEEGETVGIVGIDMNAQDVRDIQRRVLDTSVSSFILAYLGIFAAVFIVSYTITRPLRKLSAAAEALDLDQPFDPKIIEPVTRGGDEIAQFARVFSRMATQVETRTTKLKETVARLQIEIDYTKKQQQVSEITETEFFRELQQKARALRARSKV